MLTEAHKLENVLFMCLVAKGGVNKKMLKIFAKKPAKKKKRCGFTLIELLVVIAIIGILATIVLVSLNTARAKARDARRSSDMHQIALAMEMYYDSQSPVTYPNLPDIVTAIPANSVLLAPYMSIVPLDPSVTDGYKWTDAATPLSRYCAWGKLEVPTNIWVISNPNGTKQTTTEPNLTCPGASCCYSM